MNWFFWLIVIILAVLIWFICSFAYKPIGKVFYRLFKDARDEIDDCDIITEDKQNNKE